MTSRRSRVRRVLALTALGLVLPAVIEAIYLSPTAVFIDDRVQSAQVLIGNAGDTPEEATIEVKFGFPDVDSAGTPFIRFVDEPEPGMPSAAEFVRAFPQRVRLEPRSQQVVRILARPPASLEDGEYWARLIVTGRGAPRPLMTNDSNLRAGVTLEVRLVGSITYRKGRVTTGVALRNLAAEIQDDSISVWAHMTRLGNAAFLGTADVELVTDRGVSVARWSLTLAVHYPVRRRFAFPLPNVPPGDYKVRFRLRAERNDNVPADRVLPAPTVMDSVAVRAL